MAAAIDSETWTCRGCGAPHIGKRPADDTCAGCVALQVTTEPPEPAAIHRARAMVAEFEAWKGDTKSGVQLLGKAIARLDLVIRSYEMGELLPGRPRAGTSEIIPGAIGDPS